MKLFLFHGLLLSSLFFTACTEMQIASHIFKKANKNAGPACSGNEKGHLKVGKPYTSYGIRYVPIKSSYGYKKTGIASWYGADFHGRTTANGECYNMYALTAAHPTLPLPTLVRVTNLENKRTVILKVNDRGPYARGRVIDLSYRAARDLAMVDQGTAPVLVEAIGGPHHGVAASPIKSHQSTLAAARRTPYQRNQLVKQKVSQKELKLIVPKTKETILYNPKPTNTGFTYRISNKLEIEDIPPPPAPEEVPTTSAVHLEKTRIFIQTGAFGSFQNAERQQNLIKEQFKQVNVKKITDATRVLHKVHVGPFESIKEADEALARLVESGFNTAILVVEEEK